MCLSSIVVSAPALHRVRQYRPLPLDFCSNDYLGLSTDASLQVAFQRAFSTYPIGSGGSVVIGGYHLTHQQLEAAFCEALQVEGALLFNSGYIANVSMMMLLAQLKRSCALDKLSHASFYDGLKLSGGASWRYPHQRYDDLKKHWAPGTIWVAESVFSMGGHLTPFETVQQVPMIVDEAHAFGIYGQEGLGRVRACALTLEQVPLRMIPFGKALGAQGAVVVGQADWIDALLQVSRGAIYSTAMSPAFASGLISVLKRVRYADEERACLFENLVYFNQLKETSALSWLPSSTPIQHLVVGDAVRAMSIATQLSLKGLACRAIRTPTVPAKLTGLRIVLRATHTKAEILRLFESIHEADGHVASY